MAATPTNSRKKKNPNLSVIGLALLVTIAISSVDLRKQVLFLRHPTGVTTVMNVTNRTGFLTKTAERFRSAIYMPATPSTPLSTVAPRALRWPRASARDR